MIGNGASNKTIFKKIIQGPLKVVGAQVKKESGPRSKTDRLKFFTRVLY
jgi:hypothetical protein